MVPESAAMKSVLTIAGSDPSGGAGIEADLATFAAMYVQGRTAITALTVQTYLPFVRGGHREAVGGVDLQGEVHATPASILSAILHSHTRDILPDAIKIGMIATSENLNVICEFLKRHPQIPVVLDTVLRATSGLDLLEAVAIPMLREKLWPLAQVVTPNLDEVGVLLGRRPATLSEMEAAARELCCGRQVVVVKGGHLEGDPVDVAFDGHEIRHFKTTRIAAPHTRGTGCRLASAIAAHLAQGAAPFLAIQNAKAFIVQILNKYN